MWHVTNNKLYSGSATSNPVFIVGTAFNFGQGPYPPDEWTVDVDAKLARASAGNAVHMFGAYLGSGDTVGTSGGQRVVDRIGENSGLSYFSVDMNIWDNQDAARPRGSHTPYTGEPNWANSGHWKKAPHVSFMNDFVSTDGIYISTYSGVDTNWLGTNFYGTEEWHSAWLDRVKTGTTGGNTQYGKMFSWYLMDEPYNSNYHRDYESNQFSVSGHSAFCSNVESLPSVDDRPKLVDINPSCETAWTNLSNVIDILCGNDYGYSLTSTNDRYPWLTVNMVKWCWSKVSGSSTKMVMAWLPGYANSNTDAGITGGSNVCWYTFYGSIIEGARGVLWWMEQPTYSDYTNYRYLTGIYSAFLSNRIFTNTVGQTSNDRDFIMLGSKIGSNWKTNPSYTFGTNSFPRMLSNKFSALVHKYSNRYRVFVVNNTDSGDNFALEIEDADMYESGWTRAIDHEGNTANMSVDPGTFYQTLSGSLSGYKYRIYDIGSGNQ